MAAEVVASGAKGMTVGRNIWGFPQVRPALEAFKMVIHDRMSADESLAKPVYRRLRCRPQLTLTSLDFVVCVATLVGSMLLGLWLGIRKSTQGSSDGFFLAGRRLTWPIVGASLYATNIGAEHLVGLSGDSYRYGLKAGTVELGTAICIGIACWVLFPTYIKNKVFTIPEFLERRYDVRARLFFSGLMLLICVMTKMAFTLFAGALVMHSLFGWDMMSVVVLLSLAAAVVTILGGFAAVAYTDTIQTVIMIVGCTLMLLFGLDKVGGWEELVSKAGDTCTWLDRSTIPIFRSGALFSAWSMAVCSIGAWTR